MYSNVFYVHGNANIQAPESVPKHPLRTHMQCIHRFRITMKASPHCNHIFFLLPLQIEFWNDMKIDKVWNQNRALIGSVPNDILCNCCNATCMRDIEHPPSDARNLFCRSVAYHAAIHASTNNARTMYVVHVQTAHSLSPSVCVFVSTCCSSRQKQTYDINPSAWGKLEYCIRWFAYILRRHSHTCHIYVYHYATRPEAQILASPCRIY